MSINEFNVSDLVFLVLIIAAGVRGFLRGLARELVITLATIIACIVAFYYSPTISENINKVIQLQPALAYLVAFVLSYAAAYFCLYILRLAVGALVEWKFKDLLERFGGIVCGALRMTILIAIALFIFLQYPQAPAYKYIAQESWSGRFVANYGPAFYDSLQKKLPRLPVLNSPQPTPTEDNQNSTSNDESSPAPADRRDQKPR